VQVSVQDVPPCQNQEQKGNLDTMWPEDSLETPTVRHFCRLFGTEHF